MPQDLRQLPVLNFLSISPSHTNHANPDAPCHFCTCYKPVWRQ